MNVKSGRFTVKFYSVIFILKKLKQEVKKKKVKKIQTSVEEFPQERSNEVEEEDEEKDEDVYIIDSVPEKYRKEAESLLRRLRAGGGVV